jgi:hypothetical protein
VPASRDGRTEFFDLATVRKKIKAGQEGLLDELERLNSHSVGLPGDNGGKSNDWILVLEAR